ncbi:MAG: N-acyl homoserine lactonase family protein [Bacteroidales bacterium]|nr:N-acyl homoserine lactonase family protein [Bacteroidales bacterium]MDD2205010.1 N-acyl homoserine lactonase family protein [Bacteroidales bacterium]MDD3153094.1 N-acyl homoserine lactonase family protein [Bacteroidales bacterium]MDD3914488.1 N-acyl homoserine lactonase family protein [Bacteroidales bacterium]MDD4634413.1 N-acyl homoserine lactonase family protein [Bacteroidales bacterium]
MDTNQTIKVHVLHCGQVKVDIGTPFRQKTLNSLAFAGIMRSEKHQVVLPVSAYLIEHPKGLILVDAGWHTDVRNGKQAFIKKNGRLIYKASKPILPEGQAINEQLDSLGFCPEDIDYVIITHLDIDHASGLDLVKNAKNILVNDEEWKAANKPGFRYNSIWWKDVNVSTFHFQPSAIGPQDLAYDLFGDGTVLLVSTIGHSKGLTSVLVQHNEQSVLLCSDVAYAQKSWEEMILPGMTVNKREARASLEWVKQMSKNPKCKVFANHDPDVKPQTIEL